MSDKPIWPDTMREQVKILRDTFERYIPNTDPMYFVTSTRCKLLLEYIDMLEAGELPGTVPQKKMGHRG